MSERGRALRGASIRATQRHLKPYRTNYWTTAHLPNDAIGVGDRGQFAFEGLYEGAYTFEIVAEAYQKAIIERIEPGTMDLKIVLKK